jgi:hypothetical protein
MATFTDITPAEILKPGVDADAGILAELINRHHCAYSAFNAHCTALAERTAPTRQDEAENRRLLAQERASALDFAAYRPLSFAEVKAKATYVLLAAEALTDEDRQGVLRSLL